MATFQNDAVPKYRENNIPKTVKDLRNYTFNLSEQMMFLFSNLDEDNVPELAEIRIFAPLLMPVTTRSPSLVMLPLPIVLPLGSSSSPPAARVTVWF